MVNTTTREGLQPPVLRLPTELLQYIFSLSLPKYDPFACHSPVPHRGFGAIWTPPWTVSQVCRPWRTACLSYPGLWSKFEVAPSQRVANAHRGALFNAINAGSSIDDYGYQSRQQSEGQQNLLKRRIQLAHGEKLDLVIHQLSWSLEALPLLGQTLNLPHRLERLVLNIQEPRDPGMKRLYEGLSNTAYAFPSLKYLVLHLTNLQKDTFTPCFTFQYASALISLTIVNQLGWMHLPVRLRGWKLPWSQLKSLQLGAMLLSDTLDILGMTPQLQHLSIIDNSEWDSTGDRAPGIPITLPHLHSLFLCGDISNHSEDLLGYLIVPSLSILLFEMPKLPRTFAGHIKLAAHAGHIRKCTWTHSSKGDYDEDGMGSLIRAMSELEEFILQAKTTLRSFSLIATIIPSMPRLQRIVMHLHKLEVAGPIVLTMLKALDRRPQLKSVSIWFELRSTDRPEMWDRLCAQINSLHFRSLNLWGERKKDIVFKWQSSTDVF